jgi:hypothetical protein
LSHVSARASSFEIFLHHVGDFPQQIAARRRRRIVPFGRGFVRRVEREFDVFGGRTRDFVKGLPSTGEDIFKILAADVGATHSPPIKFSYCSLNFGMSYDFCAASIDFNISLIAVRPSFSGRIFTRRNITLTAAILAIGVLHFVFQISFIRREVSNTRPLFEVPPVKVEPLPAMPAESKPVAFESKKTDAPDHPKKSVPDVKSRRAAVVPLKPQPRKREAVETRAERLRRAEKILTGV